MRSDGGGGGVDTYGRVHGWQSAGNVKISEDVVVLASKGVAQSAGVPGARATWKGATLCDDCWRPALPWYNRWWPELSVFRDGGHCMKLICYDTKLATNM